MLLLQASGALGSLGPRLAALCARAAEVASDAAHLVSPMATCEGCGAAVPALALVGRSMCDDCEDSAERAMWTAALAPGLRAAYRRAADDTDPATKLN